MSDQPLISIIMNCHNGEKYLKDSIKSILDQTYQNWELIFYDNNSNDKSKQIFFEFSDKRLKYFYSKKTLKLYKARNLAINQSKGTYISFLDCDDLWKREKLSIQIEKIKNTNTSVCYSNYFVLEEKRKKIAYKNNLPEGTIKEKLLDTFCIGILTIIIKKDILEKNNLKFNDKYEIIGDFDLFLKVSEFYNFCCIQEPLAIYRLHNENTSIKKFAVYIEELKNWLHENKSQLKKQQLMKFVNNLDYKEIKFHIFMSQYKKALKNFFSPPFYLKKIKILLFFLLPKKYLRI